MIICYCDDDNRLNDALRAKIDEAATAALSSELKLGKSEIDNSPLELSISVVSADEIQEINAEYRGIDKVTDVLSFPQYESLHELKSEIGLANSILLGDVIICYDKAEEQAEEYGTGIEREIVYLATHSIFHLLGYDHMEEDEKKLMRVREEEVMKIIGLGLA